MDVDAVNATPFKRLTPEERAQLAKEGRCFRCRLQGHMARDCPKNKNPVARTTDTAATTATTTPGDKPSSPAPAPPPAKSKLTHAQQIRALEEAMEEEERSAYLDSRDMGEDFWSAEA